MSEVTISEDRFIELIERENKCFEFRDKIISIATVEATYKVNIGCTTEDLNLQINEFFKRHNIVSLEI
jgi:hypothetical protein